MRFIVLTGERDKPDVILQISTLSSIDDVYEDVSTFDKQASIKNLSKHDKWYLLETKQ